MGDPHGDQYRQYVETMAPLARNPVIIDGLATRATDALFSTNTVKNKVTEALPKSAKPLVAPVVNQVNPMYTAWRSSSSRARSSASCGTRSTGTAITR